MSKLILKEVSEGVSKLILKEVSKGVSKLIVEMSDLKSIRVIEFSGRTTDWEGWSEKFLARAKRKG